MNLSTGIGAASKIAGIANMTKIAKGLETAAEYTNPINMASKGISLPANKIADTKFPEWVMEKTMKMPPGSLRDSVRKSVLQTMVRDEQLPLNGKTIGTINNRVGELEGKINSAIDTATEAGETLNFEKVASNLEKLKETYANRPNPESYYKAIDDVKADLIEHDFVKRQTVTEKVPVKSSILDESGKPFISEMEVIRDVPTGKMGLSKGQSLKKGIYQEIQDYYNKQQKPETGRVGIRNDVDAVAKAEAAKTIRDEIMNNEMIPQEIRNMAKREAGLMNARKWVERATNRGGNLDPISLSGMMFGVLVDGGVKSGLAFHIAKSQPVLSRLAIGLAKKRELLPPKTSGAIRNVSVIKNMTDNNQWDDYMPSKPPLLD
jgi:hypothetical protein